MVLRRWGHNRLVWFSWLVGLSGFRLVSQSVGQLASVSQSVNQSISQSVNQSVCQLTSLSVGQLVSVSWPVSQSFSLSVIQSIFDINDIQKIALQQYNSTKYQCFYLILALSCSVFFWIWCEILLANTLSVYRLKQRLSFRASTPITTP